jgi:hypothetical protein
MLRCTVLSAFRPITERKVESNPPECVHFCFSLADAGETRPGRPGPLPPRRYYPFAPPPRAIPALVNLTARVGLAHPGPVADGEGEAPGEGIRRIGTRSRAEVLDLFVKRLEDYKASVVRPRGGHCTELGR